MAVHDGHRQRVKDRFLKEGLEHFKEHQVLELLLFYCIPRKDTNVIAHNLIDKFGSLHQVLEASSEELMKVDGISANSAAFLSLIASVTRYYQNSRKKDVVCLDTLEKCGEYLAPRLWGLKNEVVYLLCLDAKCKVLGCKMIGEGSVNSASVPIRKIVEAALQYNATTVILAHNHPAGVAVPSADDIYATGKVAAALEAVDVRLQDHIIVADDDYVSLAQSGLYRPGVLEY